jgi:hypothetical protein
MIQEAEIAMDIGLRVATPSDHGLIRMTGSPRAVNRES